MKIVIINNNKVKAQRSKQKNPLRFCAFARNNKKMKNNILTALILGIIILAGCTNQPKKQIKRASKTAWTNIWKLLTATALKPFL